MRSKIERKSLRKFSILTCLLFCSCGGLPQYDRIPDPSELKRLEVALSRPPLLSWSALGYARFSVDGDEAEADVQLHVDAYRRFRLKVQTHGFFSMFSRRMTIVLPGDEHVLVSRQRGPVLERTEIEESFLGEVLPYPHRQAVLALILGQVPWPRGTLPPDWRSRTRLVAASDDLRTLRFTISLARGKGEFRVEIGRRHLKRCEWIQGGITRLIFEYANYQAFGNLEMPMRVSLEAPQQKLKAQVTLDKLVPNKAWEDSDFEVF